MRFQPLFADSGDLIRHCLSRRSIQIDGGFAGVDPGGVARDRNNWTRFRFRLDASLLTITAGHVFWISPPSHGSKSTHQISPRSIGLVACIADDSFRPLHGLALAIPAGRRCHFNS